MIIDTWHNLTSVSELRSAITQIEEWARLNQVHPDSIFIAPTELKLVEHNLADGSPVYDLHCEVRS